MPYRKRSVSIQFLTTEPQAERHGSIIKGFIVLFGRPSLDPMTEWATDRYPRSPQRQ